MLSTNTNAPDFTLSDAEGTMVSLSDYRGETVVLVFYPKDNSPVCTSQLTEYASRYEDFTSRGAKLLAISTDGPEEHEKFRIRCAFPFPLLSDKDKNVSRAYDVLSFSGMSKRAVYIIDGDGMIRFATKTFPFLYPATERLLEALAV